MKVLCLYSPCAHEYIRTGWGNVLQSIGHQFVFWDPKQKPAFDVFDEYQPDMFLGTTYDVDRATAKCIAERPNMKVVLFGSAHGPVVDDVKEKGYTIDIAQPKELETIQKLKEQTGKPDFIWIHHLPEYVDYTMGRWKEVGVDYYGIPLAADLHNYYNGRYRQEFASDLVFVGGYWPYKGKNIDRLLIPLCHPSNPLNLKIKIFGNNNLWPVHQYLGLVQTNNVKDLFASAKICPNINEPHAELGYEVNERVFKVLSSGGFCISDYVEALDKMFPNGGVVLTKTTEEFFEKIRWFIDHQDEAKDIAKIGKEEVLKNHTYYHRVAYAFDKLGMKDESFKCVAGLRRFLKTHD